MTLFTLHPESRERDQNAQGACMPMIRQGTNFMDNTCDLDIKTFHVTVGNESTSRSASLQEPVPLKRIGLEEYLKHMRDYVPEDEKEFFPKTFFAERDEHILTSVQYCILPVKDGNCEFNVQLYNYQSSQLEPAVLVIVASSQGTSVQILNGSTQKLFFNAHGKACNWLATRLKDDRAAKGKATEGKMDQDEQDRNALFIYQIPLKVQTRSRGFDYAFGASSCGGGSFGLKECASLQCFSFAASSIPKKKLESSAQRGIDHAMLSIGPAHSDFVVTNKTRKLERDLNYPIRCTIQLYQVTDSIDIPEQNFQDMAKKIQAIYKSGFAHCSLVVEGDTKRKTEPTLFTATVPKELVQSQPLSSVLGMEEEED